MKVKILYISHTRMPTEKAHGHQMAQVCGAMAANGHDVALVAPDVYTPITKTVHDYYRLPLNFHVEKLPALDGHQMALCPGSLAFTVTMWSYRRALQKYLSTVHADIFYVRSPLLLSTLLQFSKRVVVELHSLPVYRRHRLVKMCNQCERVVCLTTPMRDELVQMGVESQRVIVEGDGVDVAQYDNLPEPRSAKQQLKLPIGRPVVGYVGSFVTRDTIEKGVRELIDALILLKEQGESVFGWIVGGSEDQVVFYRALAAKSGLTEDDVQIVGRVQTSEVPLHIAACDVCVYPAPRSTHPYFMRDTSPLKLFEYLASRRPVVCADLPPIRDVVDESIVTFCSPGDSTALAQAIINTLGRTDLQLRTQRGYDKARWYDWKARMRRVLEGV